MSASWIGRKQINTHSVVELERFDDARLRNREVEELQFVSMQGQQLLEAGRSTSVDAGFGEVAFRDSRGAWR